MYLADAFGYLGYVVVMFSRKLFFGRENFLDFFTMACGVTLASSLLALFVASIYFADHGRQPTPSAAVADRV